MGGGSAGGTFTAWRGLERTKQVDPAVQTRI